MPNTTKATKELRDNARCTRLTVHALCPHCDSDITEVTGDSACERYDNAHDKGRGGYRVGCESCGEPFVIEQAEVNDVQHTALVLLGED
jgi:hypothetical protein